MRSYMRIQWFRYVCVCRFFMYVCVRVCVHAPLFRGKFYDVDAVDDDDDADEMLYTCARAQ